MANEDINAIKERVRALLMKAADGSATAAEAEGAMRAAQKLMAKYQVKETDLDSLTAESYKETEYAGQRHRKAGWYVHPVDRHCANLVGKFCGVVPYIRTIDLTGELRVCMFGLESDVELAHWMLSAFKQQLEADWIIYKRYTMNSRRFKDLTEARRAFVQGFVKAIGDRLAAWMFRDSPTKGTSENTALVVKKLSLVEEEMERRGMFLGHITLAQRRISRDAHAAGAGYNSGKAANVGRATEGAGSHIMIGN